MEFLVDVPAGGTLFNTACIVAGGSIGLLAGRIIPEKAFKLVFQCLGLYCFYIGLAMASKAQNPLAVMFALLAGAVIGEGLDIDGRLTRLGDSLKRRVGAEERQGQNFTQAFVTSSLLFCVGSMAVLGAIKDGLGDPSLLVVKGAMDGVRAVLFAASQGSGALFSALPLLVYQGVITFAARWMDAFITPVMLDDLSGLGGLVILGLGVNFLEIASVKTSNLLPGIPFVLVLSACAGFF